MIINDLLIVYHSYQTGYTYVPNNRLLLIYLDAVQFIATNPLGSALILSWEVFPKLPAVRIREVSALLKHAAPARSTSEASEY